MSTLTWNFKLGPWNRRRSRRGVTIIEVLFAILVTSVGLLGAIALFPVASAQARRARLNDMLGLAGRSAFHDFDTRGMRRPDRWLAWDQNAGAFVAVTPNTLATPRSPGNLQTAESFCIDPRMIASHTTTTAVGGAQRQLMTNQSASTSPGGYAVQTFPYLEPYTDADGNSMCTPVELIRDLNGNNSPDPAEYPPTPSRFTNPSGRQFDNSLMRRITLWDGVPGTNRPGGFRWAMGLPQADAIFRVEDDISYTRPENGGPNGETRADPAKQNATFLPTGAPNSWGRRASDGKISWFATIVPIFDVSGVPSDEYTLSLVMLYDRPSRLDLLDDTMERVVKASFLDPSAATGGEIYLVAPSAEQLKLRPNDWVMVSGTYDVSHVGTGPHVTRFQWYRIAECDQEPDPITGGYQLYATVIGQDWNTSFVDLSPPPPITTAGGTPIRVTIVQGAFAVYEKTIRLEYGSTF